MRASPTRPRPWTPLAARRHQLWRSPVGITRERAVRVVKERTVPVGKSLSAAREEFERYFLLDYLRRQNGNVSRADREAGLHWQNFYQKLHKYRIERKDYLTWVSLRFEFRWGLWFVRTRNSLPA